MNPFARLAFRALLILLAVCSLVALAVLSWVSRSQPLVQVGFTVVLGLALIVLLLVHDRQVKLVQTLRAKSGDLQKVLSDRTRNFDFALDSGCIGTYHWDVHTGKLIWNNQHFVIFGLEPYEAEPSYQLFRSRVHPDDIEKLETKLEQAKLSGQDYNNDFRLKLPDGQVRFIKGRGRWTYDEQGNATAIVGIVFDNTEIRLKHFELDEKQRQLETLLENVPAVIARMDLSLRHLYVNHRIRDITGLGPEAFIGKTNEELGMEPELCEYWRKESLLVIDSMQPRKITFPFESSVDAAGTTNVSVRHFEAHIVPELNIQGRVQSLLFITHDITDLVESKIALEAKELDLRQANLRKNDFIAELAHELRNIINPLSNSVEILRIKADGKAEDLQINKIMQRQVDILIRMTNDLMDSTKIANGKMEMIKSQESLRSILEAAIDMASPTLKARGHTLCASLPDADLKIHCDPTRLTQVFTNILNNAAKYTPGHGNISVHSELSDGKVCISIADDGIGIPQEKLKHIFELFEQGGNTHQQKSGGLGVGLAIVKTLVEQHQGQVEVHSDGVDAGSTFKVVLPLQPSITLN